MSLNFKNVISPWVQSTSITNRVLSPIDRFTACYNCKSKNFQNVISGSWVHRYHKSCSQADLTVLRVITLVWTKTSKMSFISEFSVEVWQIVFSAHLTVLRLVTTVRVKTSKISYLREFSPQVSQIVFSAHLTVLRLVYKLYEQKLSKISYLRDFQCTSITNRVLNVIWPFYGFLQLYELKLQKCHMSVSSVHKYHKSCSQPNWPFLRLVTLL